MSISSTPLTTELTTLCTDLPTLSYITMPSEKFTPFHAQDIPNLSGYVVLITGGTPFYYQLLKART